MCVGATDACLGMICLPICIVVLPILGTYRLIQSIAYDIPMYLFQLTKKPHVQLQEVQAQPQDVQPQFLRITIPVSEDPIDLE